MCLSLLPADWGSIRSPNDCINLSNETLSDALCTLLEEMLVERQSSLLNEDRCSRDRERESAKPRPPQSLLNRQRVPVKHDGFRASVGRSPHNTEQRARSLIDSVAQFLTFAVNIALVDARSISEKLDPRYLGFSDRLSHDARSHSLHHPLSSRSSSELMCETHASGERRVPKHNWEQVFDDACRGRTGIIALRYSILDTALGSWDAISLSLLQPYQIGYW